MIELAISVIVLFIIFVVCSLWTIQHHQQQTQSSIDVAEWDAYHKLVE